MPPTVDNTLGVRGEGPAPEGGSLPALQAAGLTRDTLVPWGL